MQIIFIPGPSYPNVLPHQTRTNRDVETNKSKIQKLSEIQEQRLIHNFLINDFVRKFILRLMPELKGEKNRMIVDDMTNEVVKDMKTMRQLMKTTDWQEMSMLRFLI